MILTIYLIYAELLVYALVLLTYPKDYILS